MKSKERVFQGERKWSHDKKTLGVVRALAKFRQLKVRIRRKKAVSFMVRTLALMFLSFSLTLEGITELFQRCNPFIRIATSLVGTGIAFSVALAVMVARITWRRWPVKADLEPNPISLKELCATASTGDLILFSYPIRFDGFFSGFAVDILETIALKLQSKTQWTHVGVVLRGPNGNIYLCEATTDGEVTGHVGPGISRLEKRLENSDQYDIIAWRKCRWHATEEEKRIREETVFNWIIEMHSENQVGRYRLDIFRATGKIAYDVGFKEYGRLMIASGFPFEFDCCYFASCVLLKLGILCKKPEETFRIHTMPHFSTERQKESEYALDLNRAEVDGYDAQVEVIIPSKEKPSNDSKHLGRHLVHTMSSSEILGGILEDMTGEHQKID